MHGGLLSFMYMAALEMCNHSYAVRLTQLTL